MALVTVVSETIQVFNGQRYYLCGKYFQRNGRRLHVTVWERVYRQKVPNGFHVHHADHDRANNQLDNLVLLPRGTHLSHHSATPEARQRMRDLANASRHLTVDWHRSEEGRAWHREHGKVGWENIEPTAHICDYCGSTYTSRAVQTIRFCSNNCKSQARRISGVDNVQRLCVICGSLFTVNRYLKTSTCSRTCAWALRKTKQPAAS